jgi:lipopolysaccharide biosynthesis protein
MRIHDSKDEGRKTYENFNIFNYESSFIINHEKPEIDTPIGVFIHLYYHEFALDIFKHLHVINTPLEIYVSTDAEEKKSFINDKFEKSGLSARLECKVMPNRGWDLGPFLVGFSNEIPKYDICLRLHGKKSSHNLNNFGKTWREYLFKEMLRGTKEVDIIINNFILKPNTGIIMPKHWNPIKGWISIGSNYEKMKSLLSKIHTDIEPEQTINYPSGSMFWFKSSALQPLLDLNLGWDDFENSNEDQRDGTLAHAIERSILFFAASAGYNWTYIDYENVKSVKKPCIFLL